MTRRGWTIAAGSAFAVLFCGAVITGSPDTNPLAAINAFLAPYGRKVVTSVNSSHGLDEGVNPRAPEEEVRRARELLRREDNWIETESPIAWTFTFQRPDRFRHKVLDWGGDLHPRGFRTRDSEADGFESWASDDDPPFLFWGESSRT